MSYAVDLHNQVAQASVSDPLSIAASAASANYVDLTTYEGNVKIVLSSANTAGTNPTLDCKLQHSDDHSTWGDVTGKTFTQQTTALSKSLLSLGFNVRSVKRYVQLYYTIGGTASPAFTVSAVLLAQKNVQ